MRKVGMTYDNAFALCRKHREDVCPIPAFEGQLKQYEIRCRELGVIKKDDDNKKKRKVTATAIGPAIGPAMGPLTSQMAESKESLSEDAVRDEVERSSSKKLKRTAIGPAIGPAAGPAMGPPKADNMPVTDVAKEGSSGTVSIGPSIGPPTRHADR
mmetsp:Transcript_19369/g.25578  ORF Transcript_19369/g.25578 Transcript_19369/m.25578 type:complete len:156 (-) Transcript_19369:178-645(-)